MLIQIRQRYEDGDWQVDFTSLAQSLQQDVYNNLRGYPWRVEVETTLEIKAEEDKPKQEETAEEDMGSNGKRGKGQGKTGKKGKGGQTSGGAAGGNKKDGPKGRGKKGGKGRGKKGGETRPTKGKGKGKKGAESTPGKSAGKNANPWKTNRGKQRR